MKRSTTVVAVAIAATITLAGCGSSSGGSGAGTSTSSAAAGSAGHKVGDTVSLAELSKAGVAAMKKAGSAQLEVTSGTQTLHGTVSYADPVSYEIVGTAQGQDIDMRYVGGVLYMGGAAFASVTGGKKWIKVDPNGTDPISTAMGPVLKMLGQATNPATMFQTLTGVDAKVTAVSGDTTTYTSSITADQLKQAAEQLLGTSVPSGASGVAATTLVQTYDSKNLPTKIEITSGSSPMAVTYSHWGTAAAVTAPPASDVGTFDLSGLTSPTS